MTRRSSVRAQARRIYCDRKQEKAVTGKDTPLPNPPPHSPSRSRSGFASAEQGGGGEISLTARVRTLYEDSAVPVREIARLAGVTERTIYKYAAKHAWKPRYRWSPDRGWRAQAPFAPAKGAGARFIRRDDKGRPFATGLKATDPAGAARAAAECEEAECVARAAQAEAEADARTDALICAFDMMRAATRQLTDYAAERQAQGTARPTRIGELRERALFMACDHATRYVEHTAAAWQQAELRARAAKDALGRTNAAQSEHRKTARRSLNK